MKILACYSMKGGVGKTASAVNLAYWAARSGHRTLLVDLDPQGASSYYFRVRSRPKNWGKRFFKAYEQLLRQIKASDFENLDLIPAHRSFRHFDTLLESLSKRKRRLRQVLRGLRSEYDLVVLDCPPTFSRLSENIFMAADLVLVPVIPTTLSERSLAQLSQFFQEKDYQRKKLFPFFTMVDIRKKLHRETALELRNRYPGFPRYAIPNSSDVEKMGIHRAPIDQFAPRSQANSSYLALWREIEVVLAGQ